MFDAGLIYMKNCDDFEQIHLHCILLKILNYLNCFKNICDLSEFYENDNDLQVFYHKKCISIFDRGSNEDVNCILKFWYPCKKDVCEPFYIMQLNVVNQKLLNKSINDYFVFDKK